MTLSLSEKWQKAIGLGLAVIAFFAYAQFSLMAPAIENSPDDATNAFFIRTFVTQHQLTYDEPLNLLVDGRIVMRSMRAIGAEVVPIGFPGLALVYGVLAMLTSLKLVHLFTPLLVAVSVGMLYSAIRSRLSQPAAAISASLYAFHPALWYYAARGLYPNAAVVALAVMSACLLAKRIFTRRHALGATLLIALALFIRPVEVIWILPLLVLIARIEAGERSLRFATLVSGILLGALLTLIVNHWVYGAWLSSGYSASLSAPDALAATAISLRSVFARIAKFGLLLFPFQSLLALFGAGMLLKRAADRRRLLAALGGIALIVPPYAVFGARDIIVTGTPSIGTSFVRYWLPAFLIGGALTAVALERLWRSGRRFMKPAVALMMAAWIASSAFVVWSGTPDSLRPVLASLRRYESVKRDVLSATQPDAVIIAEQGDKVFFPERRIAAWLRNPGMYEAIPTMLEHAPVWYFGITLPPDDLKLLNDEKLPKSVRIEAVRDFGVETLYRFVHR